ncbi:MAG: hypothetical protein ACKO32_06425 [Planctomycetia bacterium]
MNSTPSAKQMVVLGGLLLTLLALLYLALSRKPLETAIRSSETQAVVERTAQPLAVESERIRTSAQAVEPQPAAPAGNRWVRSESDRPEVMLMKFSHAEFLKSLQTRDPQKQHDAGIRLAHLSIMHILDSQGRGVVLPQNEKIPFPTFTKEEAHFLCGNGSYKFPKTEFPEYIEILDRYLRWDQRYEGLVPRDGKRPPPVDPQPFLVDDNLRDGLLALSERAMDILLKP